VWSGLFPGYERALEISGVLITASSGQNDRLETYPTNSTPYRLLRAGQDIAFRGVERNAGS
jgi:hypothetical protein